MKTPRHIFSVLLVAVALFAGGAARADDAVFPIIVVDIQRLLQESLAAQSVQKQLVAQREKYQKEIVSEENRLRGLEQELRESRGTLSQPESSKKEQSLRQQFLEVERNVQSRRHALDDAFTDSMNVVRSNLLEVVNEVAKERKSSAAIIKQQVLWNDKSLDVTDEVLERLNKKLPSMTVTVTPKPEEEKKPDDSVKIH